jgi:hypothetical protein
VGDAPYFAVPSAGGTALNIGQEIPGVSGFSATIAPDGSHIYFRGQGAFKAAATGAVKVTTLTTGINANVVTHAPDGRRVFFMSDGAAGSALYSWVLGSADPPAQLATGIALVPGPESRAKLFFRENTSGSPNVGMLVALDLTTLERKELGMAPAGQVKLSHDEQLVLKQDPTYHVQLVRIADGKVISSFDPGDPLGFSPDDKQLAFSAKYVNTIATTDGGPAVAVARNSGDLVWMSGRVVFTRQQVREPFGFANGLYWAPGL